MAEQIFSEWRDEQRNSAYPFSDNATRSNGTDEIPRGLFVDGRLYPIGGLARQYLSGVTISATRATFTVSDSKGELAAGTYTFGSADPTVTLSDSYSRPAGILVGDVAQLELLAGWGTDAAHAFSLEEAEFAATVVIPTPSACVRALVVDGQAFTGDVWLIGEQGVFLSQDGQNIRVDLAGDPAIKSKLCNALGVSSKKRMLRTLNGMLPNTKGDFKIVSGSKQAIDTVLRIEANGNGLHLSLAGGTLADA